MLGPWMNSAMKRIVSNDELNLDKIGFEKTAIFVIYDDADPSKNFLSNILYSQIIKIALKNSQKCKNQMLPIPVRFFLDDFLSVEIPNFPTIIANCRSRNISMCMMLQDESQLEYKYGDLYKSVIGNCSTYVLTGTTDLNMARRASDRFGIKPENIRALDVNKFLIDYSGEIIEDFRYDPRQHPNYTFYNYDVNEDSSIDLDRYESFIKKDQENKPSLIEKMTSYIKSKQSAKKFVANVKNNPTDSYTEKLFFDEFKNFFNSKTFQLETQVHLNSIFSISGNKNIQVKASLMSVDFLIRDKDHYDPLFAIEIDGPQHNRDVKQIENDEIKNMFFKQSGVTLVRIPANFVYYQDKKGLWNTSDNWVIPLVNKLNAIEGYNKKISKFLSDFLAHVINDKVYFYKDLCVFRKSSIKEYIPKDFNLKTSKNMLLKIKKYYYLDNCLLTEKDDDVFASNRDDDIISSLEEVRCDNSIDLDDIDSWGLSSLMFQTPSEDYYKQRKRLENILKYNGNPGIRKIFYESDKCNKY